MNTIINKTKPRRSEVTLILYNMFFHHLCSVRNYLLHNKKPKIIILSFHPITLETIIAFWHVTVKFNYLSEEQVDEIFTN